MGQNPGLTIFGLTMGILLPESKIFPGITIKSTFRPQEMLFLYPNKLKLININAANMQAIEVVKVIRDFVITLEEPGERERNSFPLSRQWRTHF